MSDAPFVHARTAAADAPPVRTSASNSVFALADVKPTTAADAPRLRAPRTTATQQQVLAAIESCGECTRKQLMIGLAIGPNVVDRLIKELCATGAIESRQHGGSAFWRVKANAPGAAANLAEPSVSTAPIASTKPAPPPPPPSLRLTSQPSLSASSAPASWGHRGQRQRSAPDSRAIARSVALVAEGRRSGAARRLLTTRTRHALLRRQRPADAHQVRRRPPQAAGALRCASRRGAQAAPLLRHQRLPVRLAHQRRPDV